MKDAILLELAERWDKEAVTPECQDGSDDAKICNAVRKGERQELRKCADTLRTLVSILGEDKP